MSKYIVHINVLCVAIYIPFSLALWKYYLWPGFQTPGPGTSVKFEVFNLSAKRKWKCRNITDKGSASYFVFKNRSRNVKILKPETCGVTSLQLSLQV